MGHFVAGWIAGLIATVPMTLFMKAAHRRLPLRQRYVLPPREITDRLLRKAGVRQELGETKMRGVTTLAHFGFGANAGGLYGLVSRGLNWPAPVMGPVFGLLVWAISYIGVLPMAGLFPKSPREPLKRHVLMIVAHLVWGATLAASMQTIKERR
jgi:uncharacterized membrane protein YagU involved in acid resistance